MDKELRLIQVEGGDDKVENPIKLVRIITNKVFADARWNITLNGSYIKPYILLPDDRLTNLTADVYAYKDKDQQFTAGLIYLTDKNKIIKEWRKQIRQDNKDGGTTWCSFQLLQTEPMCIDISGDTDIMADVLDPRCRVGGKFLVKKGDTANDKFRDVCKGYSVFTMSSGKSDFACEWNAWGGKHTSDSPEDVQFRMQQQEKHEFPEMPLSLSAHFSRYKYGLIYSLAKPAVRRFQKVTLAKDCVLRLFPDENVRLTGKFGFDEKGHMYAQVEIYADAMNEVLGYTVKEIEHNPYKYTGKELRQLCADYGVSIIGIRLRDGIEPMTEPIFESNTVVVGGHVIKKAPLYDGMTMREAAEAGAINFDDDNDGKKDDILTALAKRYDYYKIPLDEREAQLRQLVRDIKAKFGDDITIAYIVKKSEGRHSAIIENYELPVDFLFNRFFQLPDYADTYDAPWGETFYSWRLREPYEGYYDEVIIKTKGKEYFDTTYQILKDRDYFINNFWLNHNYDEYYKSDEELQRELSGVFDMLYSADAPYVSLEGMDNYLWVRASGAVGVEGFEMPLSEVGQNWAVNNIGYGEQSGKPELVEPEEAVFKSELDTRFDTMSNRGLLKYVDAAEDAERDEKQGDNNSVRRLLLPLAAALLLGGN